MKKNALLLTTLMVLPLVSCVNRGGGKGVDTTKSQLYICYIDQGFAGEWTDKLIARFEERYKDYSFEVGKKGVQVIANPTGDINLLSAVQTAKGNETIFFVENYNADFTAGNKKENTAAADLTELFNKPLNATFGKDVNGVDIVGASDETVSVASKLRDCEKDYYLIDKTEAYGEVHENLIFGIPYIDCYRGTFSYDEDLFNRKSYFFMDDNGNIGASKNDDGATFGTGPDGVAGTADDGLPRTYAEFYKLCDTICRDNNTPITFAGNWSGYLQDLMFSLKAQNQGSVQTKELYNGQGTLNDFIDKTALGEEDTLENLVGVTQTYDASTYAKSYKTISEYAPVELMEKIFHPVGGRQYYMGANNFTKSYTHLDAQADLILTKDYNSSQKDVAMTIDGTWWWNEASEAIKRYKNKTGFDANTTRNIKYMPLPKANEAAWNRTKGENVAFSDYNTAIVEKNNLTGVKKLLSDMFISFCCTNESLVEWNLSVQCPRGLSYTLSESDIEKLSIYGKSVYYLHSQHESDNANENYSTFNIVYNQSNSEFYKTHTSEFKVDNIFDGSDSKNGKNAGVVFYGNNEIKAQDYFNQILANKGL